MALGLNGFVYSGFMCTHVDMAPELAGTLFGITNTIASFPGFLAPSVANLITKNNVSSKLNGIKAKNNVFYTVH
jgi:hypothetical protein